MINSFWRQIYHIGLSRFILSFDFLTSIALVIFIERITVHKTTYDLDYTQIITVGVGLFAFTFAALAILISMSNTKFTKEMIKAGTYENLLFHYWYTCNILLVSTSYTLFTDLAQLHNKYFELISIFLVSYSIFLLFNLIKTTISAGIYQARLTSISSNE